MNNDGKLSLEEVCDGFNKMLETPEHNIDEINYVVKLSYDLAKEKIKNKEGKGDNFVERNEFRLMLISLNHYFEYYEFFIMLDTSGDDRLTI